MDPSSSNKRQKTSGDAGLIRLISLPDGVLASVGEYLALPSRALFAVALTAPSSSWGERHWTGEPSAASRAALPPGSCNNLDFAEVEKELATSISDDDLGAALACLDAVHSLHTLKLAHCLNITGRGLEPLRGSAILQFVDLSLVGQFESPEIEGGTLSETIVISVLQSIIDAEGSALKYLALPSKWKAEKSEPLAELHRNYAQHLYSNPLPCVGNSETCGNVSGPSRTYRCDVCSHQPCLCAFAWFGEEGGDCEGAFQNYTCYECGEMFCGWCSDNCELQRCDECEKWYCDKCKPMAWCTDGCGTISCSGCERMVACKIDCCDERFCYGCEDWGMTKCDACGEGICTNHIKWNVTNEEGEPWISTCADCSRTLCVDCCKMRHCGAYRADCCSAICNDCQPTGSEECLWCDKDDPDAHVDNFYDEYERSGIRCTHCFEQATTHCSYCRKKKLQVEDYLAPSIPSSYWTSRGYDEAYAEKMEKFLHAMKVATLQLKSGETVDDGITLEGPNGIRLRHNDILLPHWQELTDALRQYNLESKHHESPFRLSNVELHPSVLDMLTLALQEKHFHALELQNLASSVNGVKLAVSYVQNNPKLARLELDGIRVDNVECLHRLFGAIADHSSLKCIRFKSICGTSVNGHDLLPSLFSCLRGRGLHLHYPLLRTTRKYDIDLESNNIRTNGATDLPDFIATNNLRLKSLRLDNNSLDDSDALRIAKALKRNTNLEQIELGGNGITEIGRDALRRAVFDSASVKAVVNSNHTCSVVGLDFASTLLNYSDSSSEKIGEKIYYLFSCRNEERSNGHMLGLELGDASLKLVPNVLERVMHHSPREYGGNHYYDNGEVVCPLSILCELVRSWKLSCREAREEALNGGA